MDIFIRNKVDGEHLQKISHYRVYFQVYNVGNILTADGKGALVGSMRVKRSRGRNLSWPETKLLTTCREICSSYVQEYIRLTGFPLTLKEAHHYIDIWVSSDGNTLVVEGVSLQYQTSSTR